LFNTGNDLFFALGSKEFYKTVGYKELAFIYGSTVKPYEVTTELINRFRYQTQNGTPNRTLQNNTEKEGRELTNHIIEKSKTILKDNGFDENGEFQGDNAVHANDNLVTISNERIIKCAGKMPNEYNIEEMLTVQISIDDVVVKKQNEKRENPESNKKSKKKRLSDTIAHIKQDGRSYTLVGDNTIQVLSFLIAFIFHNKLDGNRMQFFTDGHKVLNEAILKKFSWYKNMGIILDWFHLVKKCKELLSMGMKGRVLRNQLLPKIPIKNIKDQEKIDKLISYFEKNRGYIPCYAIRKRLGLCNSSAIGEKMNDLLVSKRQKNNGMSWSKKGSIALASITAIKRNKESKNWFEKKELEFKLAA